MPFPRCSRKRAFGEAVSFVCNFASMLTKYTLTIGSTTVDIPDECIKNWDDISFELKRTDYSGVMRSYSTEFEFVGDIAERLWALYLADGFKASARVAVYTITNTHEWAKQYEEALDFSTVEMSDGVLTINALDNSLAALIKAKKGQKYEYPVSSFNTAIPVLMTRMELKSYATWYLPIADNVPQQATYGAISMVKLDNRSVVVSKACLEPYDQNNGQTGGSENSFFMLSHQYNPQASIHVTGVLRCYLCQFHYGETVSGTPHSSEMQLMLNTESESGGNTRVIVATLFNDNVTRKTINGISYNMLAYGALDQIAGSVSELDDVQNKIVGMIGIVGQNNDPSDENYWAENLVYEWNGNAWINKGNAGSYYQDRRIDMTIDLPNNGRVMKDTHISLIITKAMSVASSEMFLIRVDWADPIESTTRSVPGISPLALATRLIESISPGSQVTIDPDDEGLIAETALVAGESLRTMGLPKIYTTFQEFCNFMNLVFGYTYAIESNTIRFASRNALFVDAITKEIGNIKDAEYTANDNLIYSTVEVGFTKKEYGEIDGRLEKNFMNYYSTGYDVTDKKLQLSSKYRADVYGVEFTMRKSNSTTTDDKADEDVFIVRYEYDANNRAVYDPGYNDVYNPSLCIARSGPYIAAMGNGAAVTLTMTSSDGDNALADVTIAAGDNLFTAGELEFTTDDMELPSDLNALVQIEHNGFRYTGFISEAECRYGKLNGVKYTLIVKEITEI